MHQFNTVYRLIAFMLFLGIQCITLHNYTFAQDGIIIDYSGNTRDQSAVLDVRSSNQGLLVPRVDIANLGTQAPIASSPAATGLLVYNTNTTTGPGYFFWDGSQWQQFFTGNSNVTGSGTATEVAFWNSGSSLSSSSNLYWDNSNSRLGIGSNSPSTALEINDGNYTTVRLENDDPGEESGIRLRTRSSGDSHWFHADIAAFSTANANDVGYLGFKVPYNNTAGVGYDLVINSDGEVGIGTTNPAADLNVIGSSGGAGAGSFIIGNTSSANLRMGYVTGDHNWIQSHGSLPLYINELGNNTILNSGSGSVGIGTTNPGSYQLNIGNTSGDYILHLGSDFGLTGDDKLNLIKFGSDGDYQILHEASGALGRNTLGLHASSSDALGFYSSGWDPLFEVAGGTGQSYFKGDMGIGTTGPDEKLHVEGEALIDLYGQGDASGLYFREGFSSGSYNLGLLIHDDGDGSPDALDISAYDGVYINTGSNSRNPRLVVDNAGVVRVLDLQGSGTRPIYAESDGTLTTTPYSGFTQIDPIYVRGTGLNNNGNRILKIGNTQVYNGGGRGLTLTIINKSNHTVVSSTNYDTYGSTAASNSLASALNGINNGQIGILTSYDAWENAVTSSLKSAFQRLGLYKALMTPTGSRRPYAAIFEASSASAVPSASAVEVEHSNNANQPHAEIRGYLIDGAYVAASQVPSGLTTPVGDFAVGVLENGNVGIGTTTPSQKLEINGGTARISGLSGGSDKIVIADTDGDLTTSTSLVGTGLGDNLGNHNATTTLDMNNNSITEVAQINFNDGEAIYDGTNLQFNSNSGYMDFRPTDSQHGLIIRDFDGSSTAWSGIRTQDDGSMELRADGAGYDQLVLADNSNVGVGTTSPSQKLDVNGNVRIRKTGNTSAIYFDAQSNDPGEIIHYENNNNGDLWFSSSDDWDAGATNDYIYFGEYSSNTQRHWFRADGTAYISNRLGIGTTGPTETLDISGNAHASGIMYWGNGDARTETRSDAGLQGNAGARSGFYETSSPSPSSNWPSGASSWWHLMDVRHSNNSNNYAMQMAGSFFDQDVYVRKTNNSASRPWSRVVTSNDIARAKTWGNTGYSSWDGWRNVTPWTNYISVKSGDVIKFDASFMTRLTGGSNNDDYYYYIEFNGCANGNQMGTSDWYRPDESGSNHDNKKQLAFVNYWDCTCNGSLRFRLWVRNVGDDGWEISNRVLIATRY